MSAWAVRMARADAAGAAGLRRRPDVRVCDQGEWVWVRGEGTGEDGGVALARLRGERYEVDAHGRVRPTGMRIPTGHLPAGTWVAAREYFRVKAQTAAMPAAVGETVALRLVRAEHVEEAGAVLTTVERWAAYAGTAPEVRLRRLEFAVSERGDVLVRGTPLPAVVGVMCVEKDGVVVQCGWRWEPAVDAATVRRVLALQEGEVALMREDGEWERLRGEHFVAASRSAARLSALRRQGGG